MASLTACNAQTSSLSSHASISTIGTSKQVLCCHAAPSAAVKSSRVCASVTCSANDSISVHNKWGQELGKSLAATAATLVLLGGGMDMSALAESELVTYYGTAASASSYGGYGGNSNKKDSAEYVIDVPAEWKERAVSKVEKGTNGLDCEFFNPKKKTEKTYLVFFSGFRRLPPKENVLNDLSLSDVNLQDLLAAAESIDISERTSESGQIFYDYEIDSPYAHSLISVTCAKNKLYAHFVNAPNAEWERDSATLKQIHDSFKTVGIEPLGY